MIWVLKKKHIAVALICCLALIVTPLLWSGLYQKAAATAAGNTNWGLSFQENGKAPRGNASADFLAQYNAYYVQQTEQKILYLTFDAGYENGNTASILDTLKKHDVKAAFFVVGNYIETSPDLVKRMVEEGHIVGNHTYHHPDMSKIADKESFQKELQSLEQLYKEGGPFPDYLDREFVILLEASYGEGQSTLLVLPDSPERLERLLCRTGIRDSPHFWIVDSTLPGEVIRSIPAERLSINGLNRLCQAVERIAPEDLKTLVQLLADKDHPSQGPSLGGLSM